MTQQLPLAPGDPVVYPKHGAGRVRALTERTVGGHARAYYEIELRTGGMQVLVPVEKAASLGLRRATLEADVPTLLAELDGPDVELPSGFQSRYRAEQGILESADIRRVTRLVGTLARRHVTRGLASSELGILQEGKKALVAELAVALSVPDAEALKLLNDRLP